jgi:hypothetical protein
MYSPSPDPAVSVIHEGESVPKLYAHTSLADVSVSVPLPPLAATMGIGLGEKIHVHGWAASPAASATSSSKGLI